MFQSLRNYISFFKFNSDKGDSLVIPLSVQFASEPLTSEYLYNGKIINADMAIDADISEWKKLAMDLNQEGKKLAIISPFPRINQDPKLCIYWFTKLNKKCPQRKYFSKYC